MNTRCVGVVGLGYVGLPLAVEFCRAGFKVVGVDVDQGRLVSLRDGVSYIGDVASGEIEELVRSGSLLPTSDFLALGQAESVSICVPTPLRKTKEPDVSFVVSAAEGVSAALRPGQVIILESTVYPGATETLVAPILEKTSLKAGQDFYLAFSPERIDPGNRFAVKDIPKLVGGINEESTARAADIYRAVFKRVIPMGSAKEAEMSKLLENTFRAVNIGLVNEVAVMSHHLGINIWNVIDAATTKPFGFMPFYPGPGWGGHCIPVDPVYLSWRAKTDGLDTRFIDHAVEINNGMPRYVVERVADLLNERGKPLKGSRLLLLGVAYKRDIADVRESPALPILSLFQEKRADVTYHDPYVPSLRENGATMRSQPLDGELLAGQDCVVITTDHSCFDYDMVARRSSLVFDTRNATGKLHKQYSNVHVL